jgi:cytochrome c oxidase cbb3-type subunit 4
MTGGIVTLLALLGFLGVVIYVFVIKRREDFDEQARQPLEDREEHESGEKENHS